jgi:predicted RNA-binding protein
MSYWIFVVTSHEEYGVTGEDILKQRMQDKFWGLGEKTPNRKSLKAGDSIVFYLGTPIRAFVAKAILSGASYQLSRQESEDVSHGKEFYRAQYGVRLEAIEIWNERRAVESLLPNLKFIENKKSWGTYFQGGVRSLSEEDFLAITGPLDFRAAVARENVLDSVSEFALEAHLEDFMDNNWELIDFGQSLIRFKTDEQDGRQFPAGAWSIDFLCTDKDSGDFVVVELKRGKSSDAVVGQILRYMTWVRENLAKPGQTTHGIIIAGAADDALRFSARAVPNVSLREYRIDFKLRPVQQ